MKRLQLLVLALCMATTSLFAQRSYNFNAVALNVDGLPNKISGIEINPDGKEAAGATALCGVLANSGWDFVGFSEDFNFHSQLTAAPASTYYNFGEHGGAVSASAIIGGASTDGLGFACSKSLTMTGGTRVKWGVYNGFTDQGADGLVTKGFRVYTVTFATGVAVDVYVLHMDADSGNKDIEVREQQLKILADYIKNNHNNRPVIVLGDTNCRYTREQLKTGFIDYINADSRFTIKDAWIEHMWGGTYPVYGSEAMMTHTYGDQKGEVVDKIFYINTTESNLVLASNSYLHDTSLTTSDHFPVVVNFTLTDPNGAPLTDAEKEDNWTLDGSDDEGGVNQKPTWAGEQVVSGTAYYLMNVGTGEYIKYGGAYYTEAVAGNAGMLITPTSTDGGNTWTLNTSTTRGWKLGDGDYTYTDQSGTWYLEPVSGTSYQYRIRSSRNLYLSTTPSESHKPIKSVAGNANDDNQKWVFLTDNRIRTEMTKASAKYPFNFTPLLKSADFDVIEYEDGWTAQGWTGFNQSSGPFMGAGTGWGGDASQYVSYAYANSTSATTMSQNLGSLPNGTYNISFEGFYRSRYKPSGLFKQEQDETRDAAVTFGSTKIAIPQNTSTSIGASADVVGPLFRDADTYLKSQQVSLASSSAVTLSVTKPATSSSAKGAWICVDNFRLIYYGTGQVAIDPYKEFKDMVVAKVNETYAKVMQLNAAGQAAYDISFVIYRYNNNLITSQADAQALCAVVDRAYANALEAHKAFIVMNVVANMQANGGDITEAIMNHSFEMGHLWGWTVGNSGWEVDVFPNANATYTTSGCDGSYLFNSYGGDDGHTSYVKQTICGIPNGLYELKADVTSFEDRCVYVVGNGYNKKVETRQGKTAFHEIVLYFLVEDCTATIGAVGGNKGGGSTFVHYWPWEGCFFKADNFRLKYICNLPHGRLKLALDEANAAAMDVYGKAALDIAKYQGYYDNRSLTTDGKSEAAAVYDALQTAAKAQRTAGADMTWAITNPNFETGDYRGWTCTTAGWETKAASQENTTYAVAGTNGRYMFNTWNEGTAEAVTQTITGIPNGTYKVSAMVASDAGKTINITANGVTEGIAASSNGASSGVFPEVTCQVTNGSLSVQVVGADKCWYKCDDFHLTLVQPSELVFNETDAVIADIQDVTYSKVKLNRTIKAGVWNTFVAPFDIPASSLEGWEVKELVSSSRDGETVNLVFGNALEGIKAGVPYMVRNKTITESVTEIVMEDIPVNTSLNNTPTDHIEFVGTYTDGYVPEGGGFISNNVFYQASEPNTNRLKGFRAYLRILDPEVRSISYRMADDNDDDEDENGDDVSVDSSVTEVTTVAIYNAAGERLETMQVGLNILQMSDGSIIKVMVKE